LQAEQLMAEMEPWVSLTPQVDQDGKADESF